MEKRWATIAGNYKVSDYGDVVWKDRVCKIRIVKGRKVVYLGKKSSSTSVHRLVAKAFIPNPKGLSFVKHLDGDYINCHHANLAWGHRNEWTGICRKCKQPKNIDDFPLKSNTRTLKDGSVKRYKYRSTECKKCKSRKDYLSRSKTRQRAQKKYNTLYYYKRKAKQFHEIHNQFKSAVRVLQDGNPIQSQPSPGRE